MSDPIATVLAATQRIRSSPGYRGLGSAERAAFDRDLGRVEQALRLGTRAAGTARAVDPYAVPLETPNDLMALEPATARPQTPPSSGAPPAAAASPVPAPPSRPPAGTEVIGERARRALDAVDFPSFVASLIQGTFQAIVDATAQQVREYARLVADLSKTVDEFTRDNVTTNQARDFLSQKHPRELALVLPKPGENVEPRLLPRADGDAAPTWLADYGLEGEELSEELVEGPLLDAGRLAVGEDRMRLLANMVLLGINRIVVDDGQLRARLQFHARASEKLTADAVAQTGGTALGIAARQSGMQTQISTLVSTVDVNTQAEASIKTDLVGEVSVRFRTETFNLDRFTDAQTVARINRHAATRAPNGAATAPTLPAAESGTTPTPTSGGST